MLDRQAPKVERMMRAVKEDLPALVGFPRTRRPPIWSTAALECGNKQIKLRTDVVGVVPNTEAHPRRGPDGAAGRMQFTSPPTFHWTSRPDHGIMILLTRWGQRRATTQRDDTHTAAPRAGTPIYGERRSLLRESSTWSCIHGGGAGMTRVETHCDGHCGGRFGQSAIHIRSSCSTGARSRSTPSCRHFYGCSSQIGRGHDSRLPAGLQLGGHSTPPAARIGIEGDADPDSLASGPIRAVPRCGHVQRSFS